MLLDASSTKKGTIVDSKGLNFYFDYNQRMVGYMTYLVLWLYSSLGRHHILVIVVQLGTSSINRKTYMRLQAAIL